MGVTPSKSVSVTTVTATVHPSTIIPMTSANTINASVRPAPAASISTVSLISTIIESAPASISTIRATETITQSILISVTPTPGGIAATPAILSTATTPTTLVPTPNRLNPSSSRSLSKTDSATESPQRAAATAPASSKASGAAPTPVPELSQKQGKGPFAPPDAILGGIPNKKIDLPVTIVFLVFFITGAATHFTIHEVNGKRGHKFHLSDMVFDFCMVRTVTCTMRIVWIFRPNNNSVVLAALIFEGAGVVVLFAVNAFFTQRIIRSIHPKVGWSGPATKLFWAIIISVPSIIVWNIINASLSVFLIKPKQAATIHDLVIFGSCYTLFLCTIPITFLSIVALFPPSSPPERFGKGGLQPKILILVLASAILTIGAVIRLVTTVNTRPIDDPGVLNSKAVFYTTGFMLEIMVVVGYALARIDLRFYVPDGCKGPGDYSRPMATGGENDQEKLVEDVDVKMRMSVASSDYGRDFISTDSASGRRLSAGEGEFPANTAAATYGGGGTPPRRPPRSMRWEGRERGGEDTDSRSVI